MCLPQKLTLQAQNALLKTIEEPPAYAVVMLLADNAKQRLRKNMLFFIFTFCTFFSH